MSQPDLHPEAIVWDLDGTLVESAPDLTTALNTLLNEQGQHGHTVDSVRPMIGAGVAKLIERGFRAAGAPIDEAGRNALVPRFMEIYTSCATDRTHLIPHAREVLSHFYHAALDIAGFFGSIVGGDSTSEKKPHPLPLQTCLEELKASPDVSIMIGDSAADVGAARAAGVPIILVPDGYTGAPAASLGADYVTGSLAEIPGSIMPHDPLLLSA